MTFDRSFSGKGVLITGGTSGIGLACARRFAVAGARVAVTYHSDSVVAERVANDLGGPDRVMTIRSDASQYADAAQAVDQVADWGPIDVLINNAGGVIRRTPTLQLEPDLWHQVMALNVDSAYYFTRLVLPQMLERGSGAIVFVSAYAASNGGSGNGSIPYGVAKAGVEAMTTGLGRDLARTGVRVNAVRAGLVDTPLHGATELDAVYGAKEDFLLRMSKLTPIGRAADAGEIADCILFLASDQASYVTGAILSATGGM